MKKFLAIALIAASFTACNDAKKEESTTSTSDTATIVTPSEAPKMDTVKVVTDSTVKTTVTTDTLKK
ncbi:MAG: hypothetical protein H7258_13420 [Ferruginibacter sp.]|nr:hypothetical protein [Ferruginibacter sp.]